MRKVIYASRATTSFDDADLRALLADSRDRNAAAALSGMLIFSAGSFLQLLEGPGAAVEETYARIMADPRHTDFRTLADEEVEARRFPTWSMGFEALDPDDLAAHLPGYRRSAFPLADPDTLTDASLAESLLTIYGRS